MHLGERRRFDGRYRCPENRDRNSRKACDATYVEERIKRASVRETETAKRGGETATVRVRLPRRPRASSRLNLFNGLREERYSAEIRILFFVTHKLWETYGRDRVLSRPRRSTPLTRGGRRVGAGQLAVEARRSGAAVPSALCASVRSH